MARRANGPGGARRRPGARRGREDARGVRGGFRGWGVAGARRGGGLGVGGSVRVWRSSCSTRPSPEKARAMGAARRAFAASARAPRGATRSRARGDARGGGGRARSETRPRPLARRDDATSRGGATTRARRARDAARERAHRARARRHETHVPRVPFEPRVGRGRAGRCGAPRAAPTPTPRPLSAGFRAATWQRKPRCGRSAMDAQSQKWSPSHPPRIAIPRMRAFGSHRFACRDWWGKSSARAIISTISRCTPPPRRARSRRGGARGRRRASPRLVRYPRRSPAARCGAPRPPPTAPDRPHPGPRGVRETCAATPSRRATTLASTRAGRSPRPRPPSPRHSQRRRPTSRTTGANLPSWSARDPPARSPRSTSRTSVGGCASSTTPPGPNAPRTRGLRRRRNRDGDERPRASPRSKLQRGADTSRSRRARRRGVVLPNPARSTRERQTSPGATTRTSQFRGAVAVNRGALADAIVDAAARAVNPRAGRSSFTDGRSAPSISPPGGRVRPGGRIESNRRVERVRVRRARVVGVVRSSRGCGRREQRGPPHAPRRRFRRRGTKHGRDGFTGRLPPPRIPTTATRFTCGPRDWRRCSRRRTPRERSRC